MSEPPPSSPSPRPGHVDPLDRWSLYERCVQASEDLVPVLRAIHRDAPTGAAEPGPPRHLGEDFAGSAALSRAWTALVPNGTAVALDRDPGAVDAARRRLSEASAARTDLVVGDVLDPPDGPATRPVDVVYAGNFSIGELHDRAALVTWLRRARARVADANGIVVCDLYGGETAFVTGVAERDLPGPDDTEILYEWEQRRADPLTGRVLDVVHFTLRRDGALVHESRDAFTYDWRLWGVPELRDAMVEAGFRSTECRPRVPDAIDDDGRVLVPVLEWPDAPDAPPPLDDSYEVLVIGRS